MAEPRLRDWLRVIISRGGEAGDLPQLQIPELPEQYWERPPEAAHVLSDEERAALHTFVFELEEALRRHPIRHASLVLHVLFILLTLVGAGLLAWAWSLWAPLGADAEGEVHLTGEVFLGGVCLGGSGIWLFRGLVQQALYRVVVRPGMVRFLERSGLPLAVFVDWVHGTDHETFLHHVPLLSTDPELSRR